MQFTLYKGNRKDGEYTATFDELRDRYAASDWNTQLFADWPIDRRVRTWLTCGEEAVAETAEEIDLLVDMICNSRVAFRRATTFNGRSAT